MRYCIQNHACTPRLRIRALYGATRLDTLDLARIPIKRFYYILYINILLYGSPKLLDRSHYHFSFSTFVLDAITRNHSSAD